MITEIHIDPNVRVADNETYSGFEDVVGDDVPNVGDTVAVREPESNIVGHGRVTRVDRGARLIYLSVDWKALIEERLPTPDELLARLAISHPPVQLEPSPPSRNMNASDTLATR